MENDGICLQIIWCPRYGIEGHHRVVIHGGEIDVVRCTLLLCSLNLRRRRLPEFHTERMGSKAAAPSATRLAAPVNGITQLYQKAGRLGFVAGWGLYHKMQPVRPESLGPQYWLPGERSTLQAPEWHIARVKAPELGSA